MHDAKRGWLVALTVCLLAAPAGAGVLSSAEVEAKTGQSIEAWGAAWWQNAFAHPELLGDTTGEFGHLGNVGGPVFFAEGSGGGPVSLHYTVPSDQFILLPVATYIWTLFDPCAEVSCAAAIVNDVVAASTGGYATIDGVPVSEMNAHLVTVEPSSPLVFQVDAGPIDASGYGGLLDAVEGGYWLMLDPLAPGAHTLSFGATVPNVDPNTGEILDGSFELAADLHLTSVPEPSTLILLLGAAALPWVRRRKRQTPPAMDTRCFGAVLPIR